MNQQLTDVLKQVPNITDIHVAAFSSCLKAQRETFANEVASTSAELEVFKKTSLHYYNKVLDLEQQLVNQTVASTNVINELHDKLNISSVDLLNSKVLAAENKQNLDLLLGLIKTESNIRGLREKVAKLQLKFNF